MSDILDYEEPVDPSPIDPNTLQSFPCPQFGPDYIETERVLLYDGTTWVASVSFIRLGNGHWIAMGHLDTYLMCKSTLKSIKRNWPAIRARIPGLLFTMADEDSPNLNRFREQYGDFVYHTDIPCTDGKSRRLYVHPGY